MAKQEINPLTPEDKEDVRITTPSAVAAGVKALTKSLEHMRNEMTASSCSKTLFSLNQKGGIDCPGCAWPDPDDRSALGEYCENGVKAIAEEATRKKADPEFFAKYSVAEMSTWRDYDIGKAGRITHPMVLRPGDTHYSVIEWEAAFQLIADQLKGLSSPNEAIFYTSGRTSNEAAFLYQLMVRKYGTNNLPDCSNMCHEASGVALSNTVGIGKGSVRLEDFYIADLILVIGQNPGTNHPRMLTALSKAKNNNAKIISINPLTETGLLSFKHPQKISHMLGSGVKLTDLYLNLNINTDAALLKGMLKMLLVKEEAAPGTVFDLEFIRDRTKGYDALIHDLKNYKLDDLINKCGVDRSKIETAVDWIASSKKIIICWAMGITQHKNSVEIIQEIVNLLLAKGSIGIPGGGTCPVRGHSNVQGDRTVGIWEKIPDHLKVNLKKNYGFEPPLEEGYSVVHAIDAMAKQKAKVFFAMGGNFLSATPDTNYTAKGLQACDLTVHVSTKPNRSHLVHGKTALILPCLGRTEIDIQESGEQFVSVENSMGIVHSSQGTLEPKSQQLKSEPAIVAGLATALFEDDQVDWNGMIGNYDLIRDAIEKNIPGFDSYNKRVRNPEGFYLPNVARDRTFKEDGKAKFTVNTLSDHSLADDEYLMMTVRSHDQYNTTIYGLDDRYRGVENGRRVLFMNPEDVKKDGLKKGDYVDISSHYDGQERIAKSFMVVPYDIPAGNLATYFPETNVLVPHDKYGKKSQTPISKSIVVKINKR
jgi:molybdopterin-dependent oxidoreductase alpha subunit